MRIPFVPSSRGRLSIGLWGAVLLYTGLLATTVTHVGVVGEVAIGALAARPPEVLVALDPPTDAVDVRGPFVARQSRPRESFGPLPLAVNDYTGALADWPAWLVRTATGSAAAGQAVVMGLGALLLALAHRFLRFHASDGAAGGVALLLATDWAFDFYKKVLGGTEVLLQAAALLVLWAFWSRRWRGGVHGTVAIAVGVGLGLAAKLTFVATLGAFGLAALLTRGDRSPMNPPGRVRPLVLVAIVVACLAPEVVGWVHHARLPPGPRIVSHDTFALQLARVGGSGELGRESAQNFGWFFGDPLASFAAAWHCAPVDGWAPLRWPTFFAAGAGTVVAWRDRAPSPSGALLRFLSLAAPLQLAAVFLLNHDLHHLAEGSVTLALWTALGADRLAGTFAGARSPRRVLLTLGFIAPAMVAGIQQLRATDTIVDTSAVPLFTQAGQAALVDLLRAHHVDRLVTSDYEVSGVLETLAPDLTVTHTWGAISAGDRDVAHIVGVAQGGWYLTLRASAPFIYNLRPKTVPGATRVDALDAGGEPWAELWKVDAVTP